MDNGIDASLGLEIALAILQRLRQQGMLQARMTHVPGIRGQCRCVITFVAGKIVSCLVEDATGARYALSLDVIVTTDRKKGPFAWSFHPQALAQQPVAQVPQQQSPTSASISNDAIPISLLLALDLSGQQTLSGNDKMTLGWIFALVDGQRTVGDIVTLLSRVHSEYIKQGLLLLSRIGAIAFIDR